MKDILGHASRSRGEIVEILLRGGTYTCPTLPHQRYDRVKQACRDLRQLGLVRVTGHTPVSVNLTPTPLFREWRRAHAGGETTLGAVRWAKARQAKASEPRPGVRSGQEADPASTPVPAPPQQHQP